MDGTSGMADTAPAAEDLPASGVYVLLACVGEEKGLRVGALGRLTLKEGYYAYVGRAKKNLAARLARHARGEGKRLRWHIDYLLQDSQLVEIWVFPLRAGECSLAAALEEEGGSRQGLPGFGSSDCRCPGHLLYLGADKPLPPRGSAAVFSARKG